MVQMHPLPPLPSPSITPHFDGFSCGRTNLICLSAALFCIGFFIPGILSFFPLHPFFSCPLSLLGSQRARRTSVGCLNKPYFITTVIMFVEYSTPASYQSPLEHNGRRMGVPARLWSALLTNKGWFLYFFSFLFFFPPQLWAESVKFGEPSIGCWSAQFFFFSSPKSLEEPLPPFVRNCFGATTLLCLPSVHSALFFRCWIVSGNSWRKSRFLILYLIHFLSCPSVQPSPNTLSPPPPSPALRLAPPQ